MSLLVNLSSTVRESKLGRCPRCIGQSLLGLIVSWSLFGLASLFGMNSSLVDITLIAAIGFTVLTASHFLVLAFRIRREQNYGRSKCCGKVSKSKEESESFLDKEMTRREFFQMMFSFGLVAAFASFIPRFALGQVADTCSGKSQTWPVNSQTATFVVCATGCGGGAGGVRDRFVGTQAGADEFCRQKSGTFCHAETCPAVGQTPQFCRCTGATLNGRARVVVQSCKEIRPKVPCSPPTNGTQHEVVLQVKFGTITCNCGCGQ